MTGPKMKIIKIPEPGHLSNALFLRQEKNEEKPSQILLAVRNQENRLVGRVREMAEIRKLWTMCQEIIRSRTPSEVGEDAWARKTHLQGCPKCGRYIKWTEWYQVKDGPNPKKESRFKRCYVCAEGEYRGKHPLVLIQGGKRRLSH